MIAHEVQGFGTWIQRGDGVWMVQTATGRFEARPYGRRFVLWWSSLDMRQSSIVGSYHNDIHSALEAARTYVPPRAASECSCGCAGECACKKGCAECKCQHTHPPSVPTKPCAEKPPKTTGGYETRLDFRTKGEAERFARSLRRRSKRPTHILGAVVYTNASGADIAAASKATKVTPAFQSIGAGHEPLAAGEALGGGEVAPVIYERGPKEFAHVTRDPEKFEACMAKARALGPIATPKAVYGLLAPRMEKQEQELFVVVPLDVHFHLRCEPIEVARGQRESVSVSLRDILRAAIQSGAKYIIVAHNHPTALCKPSAKDLELTEAIRAGCKSVELEFLDHVVIGVGRYYSIAEKKSYRAS